MSKLFLAGFFTLLTAQFALAQTNSKKFEIVGYASGFADSTLIFLDTTNAQRGIVPSDSTYIINQRFHFTGSINAPVSYVLIRTKKFEDYKFIWLENSTIKITGTKGKFRNAVVTGSKTQVEADLFDSTAGNDRLKPVKFIADHPNSIISAHVLSVYASTWGKDTASMLYNRLSDKMKQTSYGKDVAEYIALNKNPKIGEPYVDFTQKNTEGKDVSLSDYAGKIILLDFWGSWCGPCRENNVELVKLYKEFRDQGFEIFGVAADGGKKEWLDAIEKDHMTWPNVTDFNGPKNKAALAYGIYKFPTNYLINQKGILVGMDLYGDELRTRVKEMLSESP
ncbi:MAG: AhpC/TSA family protein [Chitinophagaceae bacterium]|nr:AhpC/TSA family protein [Chitinophagaceae bacterium]